MIPFKEFLCFVIIPLCPMPMIVYFLGVIAEQSPKHTLQRIYETLFKANAYLCLTLALAFPLFVIPPPGRTVFEVWAFAALALTMASQTRYFYYLLAAELVLGFIGVLK